MKKLFVLLFYFFSVSVFAASSSSLEDCGQAVAVGQPAFCGGADVQGSFTKVAMCNCVKNGLSVNDCTRLGMGGIYSTAIATYGSLDRTCAFQHDTTQGTCMNDWACYRAKGTTKNAAGEVLSCNGAENCQ